MTLIFTGCTSNDLCDISCIDTSSKNTWYQCPFGYTLPDSQGKSATQTLVYFYTWGILIKYIQEQFSLMNSCVIIEYRFLHSM